MKRLRVAVGHARSFATTWEAICKKAGLKLPRGEGVSWKPLFNEFDDVLDELESMDRRGR
jgi:hypothetical protein